MGIIYLIISLLIALAAILGVYYFVSRTIAIKNMIDNSKSHFPLCKEDSTLIKAATCYVDGIIDDIGYDRAVAIINNGQTGNAKEASLIALDFLKCSAKCIPNSIR